MRLTNIRALNVFRDFGTAFERPQGFPLRGQCVKHTAEKRRSKDAQKIKNT
jgi:hypothetical protein